MPLLNASCGLRLTGHLAGGTIDHLSSVASEGHSLAADSPIQAEIEPVIACRQSQGASFYPCPPPGTQGTRATDHHTDSGKINVRGKVMYRTVGPSFGGVSGACCLLAHEASIHGPCGQMASGNGVSSTLTVSGLISRLRWQHCRSVVCGGAGEWRAEAESWESALVESSVR